MHPAPSRAEPTRRVTCLSSIDHYKEEIAPAIEACHRCTLFYSFPNAANAYPLCVGLKPDEEIQNRFRAAYLSARRHRVRPHMPKIAPCPLRVHPEHAVVAN